MMNVIEVQALSNFLAGNMEEDATLCPVRALKSFLRMTTAIRGEGKQLFFCRQETG